MNLYIRPWPHSFLFVAMDWGTRKCSPSASSSRSQCDCSILALPDDRTFTIRRYFTDFVPNGKSKPLKVDSTSTERDDVTWDPGGDCFDFHVCATKLQIPLLREFDLEPWVPGRVSGRVTGFGSITF